MNRLVPTLFSFAMSLIALQAKDASLTPDLVILDADPLADIKNTRKIFKVMKAGEFQ